MPSGGRLNKSRGHCRRSNGEANALAQEMPVRRRQSERSVTAGGGLRRFRSREDLVRAGEGEVFGGEIRREDFDHRLVLDPDLDHVKRAAVTDKTLPSGLTGDRLDTGAIGRNAEREMRRAVAAMLRLLDEGAADLAVRRKLGAGRIDLDTGTVLVELESEKTARIGRERHRLAAHQFGQHRGGAL